MRELTVPPVRSKVCVRGIFGFPFSVTGCGHDLQSPLSPRERLFLVSDYDSPIFESDDGLSEAISQIETDSAAPEPAVPQLERLPGPGFLESIVWTISVVPMQLAGAILAAIVILVLFAAQSNLTPDQLQKLLSDQDQFQEIINSYAGLNLGIIMSVFFCGVMLLTLIRLGSHRRRAVPIQLPSPWHVVLTIFWVIPLSLLCGQLGVVADLGWVEITERIPSLQSLDDLNLMDQIGDFVKGMQPWQIFLLIAAFPAVTEELLFRVLIGRGLVARYGVVAGIGLTTVLFASVHLHPVHMVALIPLSIAIHVSYLSSRSIWIPMLAHYLNNALAVSVLLTTLGPTAEPIPAEALGDDGFLPWWLTLAAFSVSVSIGLMYWKSRVVIVRRTDATVEIEQEPYVSADRMKRAPDEGLLRQLPSFPYFAALIVTLIFFGISLAVHVYQLNGAGNAV